VTIIRKGLLLGATALVITYIVGAWQAFAIPFSPKAEKDLVRAYRFEVFSAWVLVGVSSGVGVAAVEMVSRIAHGRGSRILEVALILFSIPLLLIAGWLGLIPRGGHSEGIIGGWGLVMGLPLLAASDFYHRVVAPRRRIGLGRADIEESHS
jgi:hypothetical protein